MLRHWRIDTRVNVQNAERRDAMSETQTQPMQWLVERQQRARQQWLHDLKVDAVAWPATVIGILVLLYLIGALR